MDYTVCTDLIYLALCVAVTLLVGWTLHKNGRTFLVEIFQGREDLADSVNHLLVVGYYLGTIGFVTLTLKYGARPVDMPGAIEILATKVGIVLSVIGVLHFESLFVFSRLRWRVRLVGPQDGLAGANAPGPERPESQESRAGPETPDSWDVLGPKHPQL